VEVPKSELSSVLAKFNPWWSAEVSPDLASWRRAAFRELYEWVANPPARRAVLVTGARQVGKTTLLLQVVEELIRTGVPPSNVLYATFDHSLLKLAGFDAVIEAWRNREPRASGLEYVFFDEVQFVAHWGTWVKHQVDFGQGRRIVLTGSALPIAQAGQESGVGRWHTLRLATLSFFEYLQLRQIELPRLAELGSLKDLFAWERRALQGVAEAAAGYVAHFHEYLVRGGFPQTAQIDSITQAQRLLREDIVDKVLKRDMTALFGVRRVLDLEHTFLYLCLHDGGLLDVPALCANLEVRRPTALSFIELLEAAHLIHRLPPFGYGKDVLRARYKVYLADAAIAPAVLLKGKSVLEDPAALGIATESTVFKHLFARFYEQEVRFSYWKGRRDREIDLVAEVAGEVIPFEVKYRSQHAGVRDLRGLAEFCADRGIARAYVITKSLDDFGEMQTPVRAAGTRVMKVPAPLFCYWMGQAETLRSARARAE
jgi:predicted AAA+ superfamily ATPase